MLIFKAPSLTLVLPSGTGLNHQGSAHKLTESAAASHGWSLPLRFTAALKVSLEFKVNSVNRAFIFNQRYFFLNSSAECSHLLTPVIITSSESNTIKVFLRVPVMTQQHRKPAPHKSLSLTSI